MEEQQAAAQEQHQQVSPNTQLQHRPVSPGEIHPFHQRSEARALSPGGVTLDLEVGGDLAGDDISDLLADAALDLGAVAQALDHSAATNAALKENKDTDKEKKNSISPKDVSNKVIV